MMLKLNGCIFWLKMITCWKSIILFGIKSVLILKKNLKANLSTIKNFKTKIKPYGDEITDFYDKEDSYHTCLAVIRFYSQGRWKVLCASAFKRV